MAADRMFKTAQAVEPHPHVGRCAPAGFLAMFLGFVFVLRPLSVVGSVVPFVGSLLGAGTGLVAFLVALALSFTTIALAWLAYRPLLGGALLVVAVGSLVLLRRREGPTVVPPPIPTGA